MKTFNELRIQLLKVTYRNTNIVILKEQKFYHLIRNYWEEFLPDGFIYIEEYGMQYEFFSGKGALDMYLGEWKALNFFPLISACEDMDVICVYIGENVLTQGKLYLITEHEFANDVGEAEILKDCYLCENILELLNFIYELVLFGNKHIDIEKKTIWDSVKDKYQSFETLYEKVVLGLE